MKTYTKQDFHNPEQLTRQQVEDEYRLLLNDELPYARSYGEDIQLILEDHWVIANGDSITVSYRVPLATPLPDGTVLSSNECCWSDDGFNMTEAFSPSSKTEPSGTTVIPNLWGDALKSIPNLWGDALKSRKVTYIAGSMSAHPDDFNFPAFYSAAESLEKQGYFPINPAELDRIAGFSLERIKQLNPSEFQEFLKGAAKRDLAALQRCDAIALLPGWESSKGAKAEKAVAEWLGLEVMYLDGAECSRDGAGVFGNLGPCSACIGYDGTDGESGPVDTLSEKAPQISDAKQPYNSDERTEWDVDAPTATSTPQYAPDDPKGAAGAKKPPMHLLPPDALIETAKAMGHGAAKYGAWNFVKATVCASTYVGALGRHWAAYARGEDIDPDSGSPHLALIAANCFVLLTAQQQGTLRDDRPKLK